MDTESVLNLKRGRVTEDVPELRQDVVRIYICSTFTGQFAAALHCKLFASLELDISDMAVERTYLYKNVYPKLHQYCLERYALKFEVNLQLLYHFSTVFQKIFYLQAVDLRMNVGPIEADDHETMLLCFNEIRKCQETSVGPNFVV